MRTLESPALPVKELVGPNDVLVGDRIEFDRECSVKTLRCWVSFTGLPSSLSPRVQHSPLANRSWGWHSAGPNS